VPAEPELREAKSELREYMRAIRRSVPPVERNHLAGLMEGRLLTLASLREARTVLVFYSFGTEVATRGIREGLGAEGKRVLLPFLLGEEIEAADDRPDLPRAATSYGPNEPGGRTPVDPGEIDLVITPGLAFDRKGNRLGYGGGFYDRYLSRLGREALRVGVGFRFQLVDEVPNGPADQPVHLVVTDAEVVDCSNRSG
jgi:5-formyltetrahydrofolate cyclo-ligase